MVSTGLVSSAPSPWLVEDGPLPVSLHGLPSVSVSCL